MNGGASPDGASGLPHGENARFVREVLELNDHTLVCSGRIPAGSPFVLDGVAPGFVLLELAAQAAAVELLAGIERGTRPRVGYLTRARDVKWTAEPVPAGATLTARVRRKESLPPLYRYRASVTLKDVELFAGDFAVYVESETD